MRHQFKATFIIRLLLLSFLINQEAQSDALESEKSSPISFQKQSCDVEQNVHEVIVFCKLKVLSNLSSITFPPNNMFLKEEEIEGSAYGDYIEQTISPISQQPNLYHNPFPIPVKLHNLTDQVMTMINLKKPHKNGKLKWEIPTIIQNQDGKPLKYFPIIQEFIIENSILTLKKGGLKLVQVDLKKFSRSINNTP